MVNIARIGVREAGVFDLHTGCVTGSGGSFLIDESLLSQLSFIKEGEFSEVRGKPALKLIGNVEPLAGTTLASAKNKIIKTRGIRTGDIVLAALKQENIPEPEEFIKQICFESTAFLPVYYFMKKSGMNVAETIEMLNSVVSRSTARSKLIGRLRDRKTQQLAIPTVSTTAATTKRKYTIALLNSEVNVSVPENELDYCLQAIRCLSADEVNAKSKYLRDLLRNWFNKHYASANGALADNLRRTICWIDEALNMGVCT